MSFLHKRFPSGKIVQTKLFAQLPADDKVSILLLGETADFAKRFFELHIFKKSFINSISAPRLNVIPSKNLRTPSQASVDAFDIRKDGYLSTVTSTIPAVFQEKNLIDLTHQARFFQTAAWGSMTGEQRIAAMEETIKAWVPQKLDKDSGQPILIVELLADDVKPQASVRLNSVHNLQGASDVILFDMLNDRLGKIFPAEILDYIYFVNHDLSRVVRLTKSETVTNDRPKMLSAINRIESTFAAIVETEKSVKGNELAVDAIIQATQEVTPAVEGSVAPVKLTPREIARIARKKEYEERQASIPFKGADGKEVKISEIIAPRAPAPVVKRKATGVYADETIAQPSFDTISESYVKSGTYDHYMARVFAGLSNDPSVPHYIQKIERENTSNDLTLQETVTVQYKDLDGKSSTISVDVPILSRDMYMRINGNKLSITKQILAHPIIKVRPYEVLITTAYNKATVERFGQNATSESSYVRLLAASIQKNAPKGVKIDFSSASASNGAFLSTLEYDDIARVTRGIVTKEAAFLFSRPRLNKELEKRAPWLTKEYIEVELGEGAHPIGWLMNGETIICTKADGKLYLVQKGKKSPVRAGLSLADMIYTEVKRADSEADVPEPTTLKRKYSYSRVKMLSQYMPTALIIGYTIGMTEMMKRAGVTHRIVEKDAYSRKMAEGFDVIKFEDAYVLFDPKSINHSLLMNGIKEINTEDAPFASFGQSGIGWIDHIAEKMGGPGHAKALINYQTSFIDPMTEDILRSQGLPTDMSGVLIYANNLLEDNRYIRSNDMHSYRIRGPELINSLLYKLLHREMERVRATRESASPQKLMVNQSDLIKMIQGASNVEEVSELNPLLEAELRGKVSWTGAAGGLGDSGMVNKAMRAYDKSMLGVFGYYSPDSAEIGVKRTLSYGTAVKDVLGNIDFDTKRTKASQVLALGELVTPFVAQHADSPRIGMQSKQATHTMPVLKHTPPLVGSGAEKAIAHVIGNSFVYKSDKEGFVESIDTVNQIVKLRYKDGSTSIIDMSPRSVKNSGGGFYITSQLVLSSGMKVGKKFGEREVIAYDPSYFGETSDGAHTYKAGILTRIAVNCHDQTFEDSLMVSAKLTRDTVAKVTMTRSVSLGAKANLQKLASIGDAVTPDSALAVFENVTDDADISALLNKVGEEFNDAIGELTRNVSAAKYRGDVVGIQVYYNRDLDKLSPSLQKLINSETKRAESRMKAAAGASADEPVRTSKPVRIYSDKVSGEVVDGVLVRFFIQVEDLAAPGDKYVTASPLKGVVARVLEDGEEPFDEDGLNIDYTVSPLSIVSRMTEDAFLGMWTNAVLVDLKKEIIKIGEA